jgi:plastocyanin
MNLIFDRREMLKRLGVGAAALLPALVSKSAVAEDGVVEIRVESFYPRGQWFYEPSGIYIPLGTKARWIANDYGATVTSFHPSIDNHELRIPEKAKPFDSGVLSRYGRYRIFEWTFDVEGTYDYFSRTFEPIGTVGRIVVGKPGGPGEQPPGYGGREGRAVVFPAEAKILDALPSGEIVAKKSIAYPKDLVVRSFPFGDLNR